MIAAGGMRLPRSAETCRPIAHHSGNILSAEHIRMDGIGVLSFFNATVPCAVKEILAANGVRLADIDVFVFHQASQIVLDTLRMALEIPPQKLIYDLADGGNLVSASIPVALKRASDRGLVKSGQLALLCGFGVGLSWGTGLVEL